MEENSYEKKTVSERMADPVRLFSEAVFASDPEKQNAARPDTAAAEKAPETVDISS